MLPELSTQTLFESLFKREALRSTSTSEGVALPHAIRGDIPKPGIIVQTLKAPVQMGPNRVRIVVALFGSSSEPWVHVRVLARVARVCLQPTVREAMLACTTDAELLSFFDKEFNIHAK